jgi:hypothetical protein
LQPFLLAVFIFRVKQVCCEIWGTHSSVYETISPLWCYVMSNGKELPLFRRVAVPPSSWLSICLWLLHHEDGGTKILPEVCNCVPVNTAWYPRRL